MEDFKKDLFIIAYSIADTSDWMGSFPMELHQWFVMDGKLPKTFDTEDEARKYAEENFLISNRIIKLSGNECHEKTLAENIQGILNMFGVNVTQKQAYMVYFSMIEFHRMGLKFSMNDVSEIKFNAGNFFGHETN